MVGRRHVLTGEPQMRHSRLAYSFGAGRCLQSMPTNFATLPIAAEKQR